MMLTIFCVNTALKTTKLVCTVDDVRLDVFLAANVPGLTRSAAQKLLDAGCVSLEGVSGISNGKDTCKITPAKKNHKTVSGEVYIILQDEPVISVTAGQDIGLDIVFEDDDVIVVNKPQGMVVHPAPGHSDGTLVNALIFHCGDSLSGIGGVLRPGIVHRIDKDTSGLIIAAKNDGAHLSLTRQLSSRTLTREYDAIVYGFLKSDTGTIDAPIGRHPTDRKRMAVINKNSRSAVTHYSVIMRYNGYTHVCCRLETGRTHQIRVHMAHIGHPVLGDPVYGGRRKVRTLGMECQCLHARRLRFVHPASGEPVELCSELPEYFLSVLEKLKAF